MFIKILLYILLSHFFEFKGNKLKKVHNKESRVGLHNEFDTAYTQYEQLIPIDASCQQLKRSYTCNIYAAIYIYGIAAIM